MNNHAHNKWSLLTSLEAYDMSTAIIRELHRFLGVMFYRRVFNSFGKRSILYPPLLLVHPSCIDIGDGTIIRQGVRLEIVRDDPSSTPQITIGNNVNIEQYVHIVCRTRITIGSNVSITGFCSIVDTSHSVDGLRADDKIGSHIDHAEAPVEICDGAFLGMGARILPGVRIGRGAVVGANAVVTRDVPDYHIATGVPAVVRRARSLTDMSVAPFSY